MQIFLFRLHKILDLMIFMNLVNIAFTPHLQVKTNQQIHKKSEIIK